HGQKPIPAWKPWLVAIPAVWAIANLVLYVASNTAAETSAAIGFVTRAMDFGSGVSPTLPVMFLAATIVLWSATELTRGRRPRIVRADGDVKRLLQRTIAGTVDRLREPWTYFNRSIVAVPLPLAAIVGLSVAVIAAFVFDPVRSPLVTIEGPSFSRFVSTGL